MGLPPPTVETPTASSPDSMLCTAKLTALSGPADCHMPHKAFCNISILQILVTAA